MNFFQRLLFRVFPPKTIPIIINGGDVSEAGAAHSLSSCLIATALKRRYYPIIYMGFNDVNILGHNYRFNIDAVFDAWIGKGRQQGAYDPSIIGTKFELTRI